MTSASASPPSGIFAWLANLGLRGEQSIGRHERGYLSAALAIFTAFATLKACTNAFWFDEFLTFFVSQLPSVAHMLRAMPADGQPPLQYLLTRFSLSLLGRTEFAARLPELMAYPIAGLLTFKIVRRHGTGVQALFATCLLMGSILDIEQAFTARPYCLLLAFTALAFACWQTASLSQHRRIVPLAGLALGIAGAVLSHHFAIFEIGIFLFAGEAARIFLRRRIDFPMATAIAVGFTALAITVPLARQSNGSLGQAILHSTIFWSKPSPLNLFSYLGMVALPPLFLVAIFYFLPWPSRKNPAPISSAPSIPTYEWVAAAALALLLPVLIGIASFATGYFLPRYAIACSLGLALLIAWAAPHLRRLRSIAQPLLALSTLTFLLLTTAAVVWEQWSSPIQDRVSVAATVPSILLNAPAGQSIVLSNAYDYSTDWWYSPAPIQKRMIYLTDTAYAARQSDFLPEFSLAIDQPFIPIPTTAYDAFIADHPHFLLLRSGKARLNWTDSRLAASGWRLTPIAKDGIDILYQVDHP